MDYRVIVPKTGSRAADIERGARHQRPDGVETVVMMGRLPELLLNVVKKLSLPIAHH